ncbi:hypothetical protein [Salinisphaera orenii]|nr:hypothetical protein [Salinisphaera orenii]
MTAPNPQVNAVERAERFDSITVTAVRVDPGTDRPDADIIPAKA